MRVTIALSVESIAAGVYARTALHSLTDSRRPEPLTRDNAPLLRAIIRSAMIDIMARMTPQLCESDFDADADNDIVTLTFEAPSGTDARLLRAALSQAVGMAVMAEVSGTIDTAMAETCRRQSARMVERAREMCIPVATGLASLRITDSWL